jgi:hypothetical protein
MGKWPHAKANTAALAAVAAAIDLGPDAPPVELRNQSAHGAELEIEAEGLFSIRPIEVKRFQAICDCDVCCHSRILSSLRDRLFGSPIMGSGR